VSARRHRFELVADIALAVCYLLGLFMLACRFA
jgi:hypothetical protein